MRFTKGKKEEEPRLGIAPLIDVVFLLLIFFMVTSHFNIASGIPIRLPQVSQKYYDKEEHKIVVVLDTWGNIYVEGEQNTPEELAATLRELVEREGYVQLLLQADQEVRHGRVVEMMDLAKTAGVASIVIAAQWETQRHQD